MFQPLAALSLLKKVCLNRQVTCRILATICYPAPTRQTTYGRCQLHTSTVRSSIFSQNKVAAVDTATDLPDFGQPMESWYYDVYKNGKITVRSLLDVHIQSLDPQKYPNMNRLLISIIYIGNDRLSSSQLFDLTKQYIVNIDLDDNNRDIELAIKQKIDRKLDALCYIQVPVSYGKISF